MTKTERIRDLYDGKRSPKEIAAIVAEEFGSCLVEYVRVVTRQRSGGLSGADRRYIESPLGREMRRRNQMTPKSAARRQKYNKDLWQRILQDPVRHEKERERKREHARRRAFSHAA